MAPKKGTKMPNKKKPTPWKDEFYVRCYELARAGFNTHEIAKEIGVAYPTLQGWMLSKPALKEALSLANRMHDDADSVPNLLDYVYQRLPEPLRAVWDRVEEINETTNATREVELLMEQAGKTARQHLFLHAMVKYNFNPSEACRAVNVSKKSLDNWAKTDPDFFDLLAEMKWHITNFCEASLMELVRRLDPSAVRFALENLMPEKYASKKNVNITGDVKVEHRVKAADLPYEVQLQLLEAIEAKEKQKPALPYGIKELDPSEVTVRNGTHKELDNVVKEVQQDQNGQGKRGE